MKDSLEHTRRERLKTLTAIRALFVTVLLGSFFVFEIGYSIFPYPNSVLYLIMFLYILTIVYSVLHGRMNPLVLAYAQFSLDALSVITLIFLTGGIESWFSPLMLLVVIAGPIVLNKRAGYFNAALMGILYGVLIDLQYYHIIPIPYESRLLEKDFLYNMFAHMSALFLTAYLTGFLSSRLERASKRLEERDIDLRDLAIFNREVIESVPSGLFTTDTGGKVMLFNKSAEAITGMKGSEAVGRDIRRLFPFITRLEEKRHSEGILEHGGSRKVLWLAVSKMKDAKGADAGFIGVFQDLTHLKEMETEMKRKEQWAAIGELSANMAHEIRNPLASLKGAIEILKEDAVPKAHKEQLMEIAISEMERLNRIINDFLTYSRPKALDVMEFDLNGLLGETIELIKTREMENIEFEKDFSGPIQMEGDRQKLQQVFLNLGINAVDAMPEGGRLTVRARETAGGVDVSFSDTGEGIKEGDVQKIFYPFFTTKQDGTGLGLSIAYRIIEDHNGTINVRGAEDGGTTFEISLPKRPNGTKKG